MATTITNKGNALLAKLAQGIDLELTSAKTGAGTVDASLLQAQTGVTNMKQEITIKSFSFPEPGTCALVLELTNDGVATGYTLMQIGIYAQDPDEGEILFSIWQVDDAGITIHSETVLPGYSAEWNYNIKFDQAESVTVNVDPSNTISQATMESYVEREVKSVINAHTGNTSNPHNVTPAQIGLGNVDNTADNDKHVAYAVRAGEADKTKSAITIRIDGGRTENTDQWTFDGSTAKAINITPERIGLGNVDNTADNDKHVAYAVRAGEADKTKSAITIHLDGGRTEGTDQFTFDGSTSKSVNITPEKIGSLSADEIANLYVWDKYDAVPFIETKQVGGMPEGDDLGGAIVRQGHSISYSDEIVLNNGEIGFGVGIHTASISDAEYLETEVRGKYFYSTLQNSYGYFPPEAVAYEKKVDGQHDCFYVDILYLKVVDPKGSKIGLSASKERDTYPTDYKHTDGLWYVYRKQLGE